MKLRQGVENKQKLSSTLRNWLPILHASLGDLEQAITPMLEGNVVARVSSGFEDSFESKIPKKILQGNVKTSQSEHIEALTVQNKSLYDILDEQITGHLFPTPQSIAIAQKIIEQISHEGYYEGDAIEDAQSLDVSVEMFERVRGRFAYLEPAGIGAKDVKESFHFQLLQSTLPKEYFALASQMIDALENLSQFSAIEGYEEALRVIGRFANPPAMAYFEKESDIIPDIYIYDTPQGGIDVVLNDRYYPTIEIDESYGIEHAYITQKIKEAKSLVDALEMRKATLYKVGLMIVEYQYEFFTGGDMKPMTLKTLADEFGHNPSTISRAIANKFIASSRGVLPMKSFFTTALDEDISNAAVKDFIIGLVKAEDGKRPLSDMKLLSLVQKKFGITMVRRTIAKYRKQLGIAGSSERKKLYKIGAH
ncbi:MAG: RNA polymerase sigma54 factor [Sulfuricurvum sp. PC08-66]|nr:MAG: RNA polymerase sigma54 factor [Sulfuricurvum sp. PC08-66]